MNYLVKTPWWLRALYPGLLWKMPRHGNKVYLTFDDGPTPEVTPWVLGQLEKYGFSASFFLIGDMVDKHPEVYRQVMKSPHSVGNHTYNHLNGWKTPLKDYLENTALCADKVHTKLFRPPYGRVRKRQSRALRGLGYNIIMWDVVSGDFDLKLDGEACARNVIRTMRPGSIIVFHDSEKAWPRLKIALPLVLEEIKKRGWISANL